MVVTLHLADLLKCRAEAILLTVDGSAPGMEGTIARSFAKLHPEAWTTITEQIQFPMLLGAADAFEVDASVNDFYPKVVVLASTLHHLESFSTGQKLEVIRSSLRSSLDFAKIYHAKSLASAVLAGGWRLPPVRAANEMLETYFRATFSQQLPSLQIHLIDESLIREIIEDVKNRNYLEILETSDGFQIRRSNQA